MTIEDNSMPELKQLQQKSEAGVHTSRRASQELRWTREALGRSQVAWLFTELDLGQTFADIAATSERPERRAANRRNARKALDTLERLRERVREWLTGQEALEIDERMEHIRATLHPLGDE